MKLINIISNDKIYAEMLCLELEAAGYRACRGHMSGAVLTICDTDSFTPPENTAVITFSENKEADLTRPFEITQLLKLIDKKATSEDTHDLPKEEQKLWFDGQNVFYGNERIELSALEFKLLAYLYQNRGIAVESSCLSKKIFQKEDDSNLVRVYISYLREKIDKKFNTHLIKTVRNKGYMLNE